MPDDPDAIYADARLAVLYDLFDGSRDDLDIYEEIIDELEATRVLDLGCGTGALAIRLHARGLEVVGVDPAGASIDVARAKPGGDAITWIVGDATHLDHSQPAPFDLAVSTGNAVQGIVAHEDWHGALTALATAIRPGGHLVFETRVPERRAWESWTPESSHQVGRTPDGARVETWNEVIAVDLPLVTFETTFRFPDHTVLSTSVLRFRSLDEITSDLDVAGFDVVDVRDAPDRPGLEWIFVARRRDLR
jgi:SAM-dependent methyltransferase